MELRILDVNLDETFSLLDQVEIYNAEVATHLDSKHRSKMGQYFTPSSIANLMASMFSETQTNEIRLLDAGAGIGMLTVAFIERACRQNKRPDLVHSTVFEVEPLLIDYLSLALEACKIICEDAGIQLAVDVQVEDFIDAGVDMLWGEIGLFAQDHPTFNRIILNPPYRKIRSSSKHRKLLHSVGIETSNLYAGFLAIAIRLLEPGGEIVAITPRSFCNGPYFRPFRDILLDNLAIKRIHVFETRDQAFDDVLQENIIFHAVKNGQRDRVIISVNEGPDDPLVNYRDVNYRQVIDPDDPHRFIHIATTNVAQFVVDRMHALTHTLEDLGLEVSTGRVVDFRAKAHLRKLPTSKTVPLIYPTHFQNGFIDWPKLTSKKPNALMHTLESESLLLPNGNYVLVKRFSAKEELRRITATLYLKDGFETRYVGFENHLNVYHQNHHGIPEDLAKGLAVFLSSTLVDQYFRQFSGHTQVNATDLRTLRYPSLEILEHLGSLVHKGDFPNQSEIDETLEKEINTMADIDSQNPIIVERKIEEAQTILKALGFPPQQHNERSGLALLALLDLEPSKAWSEAGDPLIGITPMMDFVRKHYGRNYKPNTRETFRRQTVHQFEEAGLIIANPDEPDRPTNSPHFCYQIEPSALSLIQAFSTERWEVKLRAYLHSVETLKERYAMRREMNLVPVKLAGGQEVNLSPGEHSELIKAIVEEFGPRFVPGGQLLYLGDTGEKWGYFDQDMLEKLGVSVNAHGKMPDVVIYFPPKDWLLLIEAVTSHGPVDAKRRIELAKLFENAQPGLVYVTAFLTRADMARYVSEISWETEVWINEAKTHLIHFNGKRFLGPYGE